MTAFFTFLFYGCCLAALSVVQKSDPGALGLNLLVNPPDAEVDIVAVHGLDGHWRRSWTAENGTFWLQDLLPNRLPKARVYSYSHNSKTRGGDVPLTLDISVHGRELVRVLTAERMETTTEQRPIIFIAHSLGGIILKNALLHSDMARPGHLEEQKSVKLSTYAVFFLGTPHQGAEGVELAQILTKVLSLFSHTNGRLLKDMKRNSDLLVDLQRRYNAISGDFKTLFYYETFKMPVPLLGHFLVVPESSAVVFGAVDAEAIPLDADHSTMVKFTGEEDGNFWKVAEMLYLHYTKAAAAILRNWENWSSMRAYHANYETSHKTGQMPREFQIGLGFKNVWNRHFTGRDRILQLMDGLLRPEPHQQKPRVTVIYGPGGIGKTQLALEYARQQQRRYSSIFWIDARHADTVKTSIRECGNRILAHYRLHGIDKSPRFHFLEKEMESGRVIESFLMWLAYEGNRSWLLIIDNLDDLENVSLRELLPSSSWGSILVTSRRADLAVAWESIEVPVVEYTEAYNLLLRSSNLKPETGTEDCRSAQAIVEQLGYLPLAIAQAGAHIAMHHSKTPFQTYLKLYLKYPRDVLAQKARKADWDTANHAVLTTWEISFNAVRREMAEAADILLISGHMAPEGISQDLLTSGGFFSEFQVQKALGILLSYSFIHWSVGASDISVHPLIHLWARLRLDFEEQETIKQTSLDMLRAYADNPPYASIEPHILHLFSVFARTEPCNLPADHFDLSVVRHVVTEGNIFRLHPDTREDQNAFSDDDSVISGFSPGHRSRRLQSEEFNRMRHNVLVWRDFESYLDKDLPTYGELGTIPSWEFCQATKLFPTHDKEILKILFDNAEYASFVRNDAVDHRWYSWLLIWFGKTTMHQHPVVAGLQVGFGLLLEFCSKEIEHLAEAYVLARNNVSTINESHERMEACLYRNPEDPRQKSELFRAIVSWSLVIVVFCFQETWSPSVDWNYLPGIGYTRDATDPLSKAVLMGLVGDNPQTTTPYMSLHLLDWKGSRCLRAWPVFVTYMAEQFETLAKNEFGEQSAHQLAISWAKEHEARVPSEYCFKYKYQTKDGTFKCCCSEEEYPCGAYTQRRIEMECPADWKDAYLDPTNESQCQMGQLALYLSMWHTGTGNATPARLWLEHVYTKPLKLSDNEDDNEDIAWEERCLFHDPQLKRRQARLLILDEDKNLRRLASYETDIVFDYIANVAIDILRGFHHAAIRNGRFSKQATQGWPEISKSMAQLLLRPSMHEVITQDADFARFLVHSGNVPEGATLREKRALRAWETYGKKCPGRVLHQMIVDSVRWFASQTKLPRECFIEDPLSITCPAVLIASRAKDSVIRRSWKALSKYGHFCLTIVMRAFQ